MNEDLAGIQREILKLLKSENATYANPISSSHLGEVLKVTPSYVREQIQELLKLRYVEVRKGRGGGYYLLS